MKKDVIVADGKWTFDKNVTDCFDDMLSRSIPDYNTMRELTIRVADEFIGHNKIFNMNIKLYRIANINNNNEIVFETNFQEKEQNIKNMSSSELGEYAIALNNYTIP